MNISVTKEAAKKLTFEKFKKDYEKFFVATPEMKREEKMRAVYDGMIKKALEK